MGTVTVDIAPAATFANPWAFNFLPDGRMLVTDAFAGLRIVTQLGVKSEAASGLPADLNVPYDVVPSPSYATDHTIFLSYSELGPGGVRLTPQF
jgi:glucose/arabinose dehydrogenase